MATQINTDGTVTEFKINNEEIKAIEYSSKLKKDGTPRKAMGPRKKYTNERKAISAFIDVQDLNLLLGEFGTGTKAILALIDHYKQTKEG